MRLLFAILLASSSAGAAEVQSPAVSDAAAKTVIPAAWTTGASCAEGLFDFVIDTDGQVYQRGATGFTPLTGLTLEGDFVVATDEVGIGRTTSRYLLGPDGSLRLMSEVFDPGFGEPPAEVDPEPVVERVKDGRIVINDEGNPVSPGAETPIYQPCPKPKAFYADDVIAALEGTWATGDGKGGICARDADSVTFQLSRPVPHVLRGPFGGEVTSTSYALKIVKEGGAYIVTEGNAFEAGDYTFTPDGKGGLVQANPYADGPLELYRCP